MKSVRLTSCFVCGRLRPLLRPIPSSPTSRWRLCLLLPCVASSVTISAFSSLNMPVLLTVCSGFALCRPVTRVRNGYSLLARRSLPRRASLSLTLQGASLSLLASSACHRMALRSWHLVCTTVRTRFPCPPAISVRCTAIPRFLPTIPSSAALLPQQAPRLAPSSAWACLPGALVAPRKRLAQMVLLLSIDPTRAQFLCLVA